MVSLHIVSFALEIYVSIDFGVRYDGYFGDAAVTLGVGEVNQTARQLMAATEEALYAGIAQIVIGNRLSDVSHAVQKTVEAYGFSVIRDFVGHGIGRSLHEDPQIPNYGLPGQGPMLTTRHDLCHRTDGECR